MDGVTSESGHRDELRILDKWRIFFKYGTFWRFHGNHVWVPPIATECCRYITNGIPNLFLDTVAPIAPPGIIFLDFSSPTLLVEVIPPNRPG